MLVLNENLVMESLMEIFPARDDTRKVIGMSRWGEGSPRRHTSSVTSDLCNILV